MENISSNYSQYDGLNGGSIDYQHFDDRARELRSSLFLALINGLKRRVKLTRSKFTVSERSNLETQRGAKEEIDRDKLTTVDNIAAIAEYTDAANDGFEKPVDSIVVGEGWLR